MNTPSTLLALAEKVEAAVAADRAVECDIGEALGWKSQEGRSRLDKSWFWTAPDGNFTDLPSFTESIDAAMTLVPEGPGRWPQIIYRGPNPNNGDQGHRVEIWATGQSVVKGRSKHSFALALTAACLRARAAIRHHKEHDRG